MRRFSAAIAAVTSPPRAAPSSGSIASSIAASARWIEPVEAGREPGRALRAHTPQHALPLGGQLDLHPAAIAARAGHPLDETGPLEAVDVLGHRRRGNALAGGELSEPDSPLAARSTPSSVACPPVTPKACASRRSSRPRRSSTGRSRFATETAVVYFRSSPTFT